MSLKSIILCSSVLLLSACSSVSGVVRDKETLTPISSATVTVTRNDTSTTTNAVGHYRLSGTFFRGDTLMINAPGYNIYTGTLQSAHDEIMDIELTPKK